MASGFVQRWKGKIAAAVGTFYYGGVVAHPPFTNAGAPTNGTTLAGIIPVGALLLDITNAQAYINTGTQASPVFSLIANSGGNSPTALTAITDGITAHAGGTKVAAVPLTSKWNRLSVVATGGDSVLLPVAAVGTEVLIINGGAAAAQVFGAGTDTVDGVATGTGVVLTNAKAAKFYCLTAGAWHSMEGVLSV